LPNDEAHVAVSVKRGVIREGGAGGAEGLALGTAVGGGDGGDVRIWIAIGHNVAICDGISIDVVEEVIGLTGRIGCGDGLGCGSR